MPYAINRGAKIYWDERGAGPPLLLIMGLSFTHDMWFRVLPKLSASYRTIFFDNRGMGRSDVPRGPYRMRLLAQDAVAVLDAAGVSAAHIVGASMGGMIAQEVALRHPRRVLSLVLGCTSYGGLFARWPDRKATSLIPMLYADSTPPERIAEDFAVRNGCVWTNRGFWGQFSGILLWNSYRRLPRIKAPTLVVHGAEDRLVSPKNGRTVARRIPGARFELIPNAGHIITTDQPEACLSLMLRFLEERC